MKAHFFTTTGARLTVVYINTTGEIFFYDQRR